MNIPFDITAGKGPVIADPIRTMEVRVLGYYLYLCGLKGNFEGIRLGGGQAASKVPVSADPVHD